jgi:hypothetical protein
VHFNEAGDAVLLRSSASVGKTDSVASNASGEVSVANVDHRLLQEAEPAAPQLRLKRGNISSEVIIPMTR